MLLATSSCSSVGLGGDETAPQNGHPGYVTGFLGGVVADEPQAALVARDVLSAGGTAADAAVALGFALSVTLPSRAGLGGGGACLTYAPDTGGPGKGVPQAIMFVPPAPSHPGDADRPAAVPMLARGLFALHARYGNRRFESLITPAEELARRGTSASRAFVRDLSVVAGPLAADPGAFAVFFPGGKPLTEGAQFIQPGLGATLAQLRTAGVGDFYQGTLAHVLVDSAHDAGAGLSLTDLRGALPTTLVPLSLPIGDDTATFLPPPADGGLAARRPSRCCGTTRPHFRRPARGPWRRRRAGGRWRRHPAAPPPRPSWPPPRCPPRRCRRCPPPPPSSRLTAWVTRWSVR